MLDQITFYLLTFEDLLWGYIGVPMMLLLGLILTIQSRGAQIRNFPKAVMTFISFFKTEETNQEGVPPLKAFFACIGGSVGVGNVVGVCTAVQIGGPGALFWIWVTAIAGAVIKYSEVYLGVRYRELDKQGRYVGGPMYFLKKVFKQSWISSVICGLICLYGVEIFQFSVVTKNIAVNMDWNLYVVVGIFLALVIFASSGGVKRVGSISSALIPIFVFTYVGMGMWVLLNNLGSIPAVFGKVFSSAFSGHAALGAFVGSSILSTVSQGVRRGCYSADIGIGYASVIHAETNVTVPEKQASLVIFEIMMDTFLICTTSVVLILVTGVWQEPLESSLLIQTVLSKYFPYMHFFMPFFLFLVGYATINAYFCVGLKCAEQLMPRFGRPLYYMYAVIVLVAFSFVDTTLAQSVMAIAGGFLLVINSIGIYLMRQHISFDLPAEAPSRQSNIFIPVPDTN